MTAPASSTPEPPGLLLQVGGQRVALAPDAPCALPHGIAVEQVHARVRCEACSALTTLVAAPTVVVHDDDHFAHVDVYWQADLAGACAGCGADLRLHVGYCVTSQNLTPHVQAEIDRRWHARGCELASPPPA